MTAATVTPPPVFAEPGHAACTERNVSESVRCDRPPGHQGGHLNKDRNLYWRAEQ